MGPLHLVNELRQAIARIGERQDSHDPEPIRKWREVKAD
jgi:hypothetical protein